MATEWDANAALRRAQIESGKDLTFSKVFVPMYVDLVTALKPRSILEAGSGTGHLALALSSLTNTYVGVEPSRGMASEAKSVLRKHSVRVFPSTLQDLTTDEVFDLALSHMCLQAIQDYQGFLTALARVIGAGGAFLVAFPHPSFFNEYKNFIPSREFSYMRTQNVSVDFEVTLDPGAKVKGVPYFHRPLTHYFSAFANAGLAVTYMEEVQPPLEVQNLYGAPWKSPRYIILGGTRLGDPVAAGQGTSVAARLLELEKQLVARACGG